VSTFSSRDAAAIRRARGVADELGRVGVLGLILLLVCLYGEALPYPFMLLTLFAALGLSL